MNTQKSNSASLAQNLKWYDILVVTLILFGWAAFKSTGILLGFIQSNDTGAATADFNYMPNFILQSVLLLVAIAYLFFRGFDFKKLPIRFKWSVLLWTPIIFMALGLLVDIVNTATGRYNYFSPEMFAHVSWKFIFKFAAGWPLMMVLYGLLNGFYEEFFFLGILPTVEKKYGLPLLLLYSTIIRVSFHTYQGWIPTLSTGIGVGLLFFVLYRFKVKNLLPFFLAHALWDILGGSLMYLITVWS